METNIHTTFRSGFSASLRERRMAHQTPTAPEQAASVVRDAETIAQSPDAAVEGRLNDLRTRLDALRAAANPTDHAAIDTHIASFIALRTRRTAEATALTTFNTNHRREVTETVAQRNADAPVAPATLDTAGRPWSTRAKNKIQDYYTAMHNLSVASPRAHNFNAQLQAMSAAIRELRAVRPGNADLALTVAAPVAPDDLATLQDDRNNTIRGDAAAPAGSLERLGATAVARLFREKSASTDPLDVLEVTRYRTFLQNLKTAKLPGLITKVDGLASLALAARHVETDSQIRELTEFIAEITVVLNASVDAPSSAPTTGPSTGPSTGPTTGPAGTPEAAFNNLPTTIRPFARDLRDAIINGTDTAAALAGINAQLASRPAAEHEGIRSLLDTYLRNTPKTVRLTGAVLSIADRTATPSGTPGSYPPAGPGVMGALPPLPAGMEQPANAFFNQARPFLGILRDIGVLPPSFAIAMNAMNGREVTALQNEINVRNQQLAERRTRLTTLAVGSPERTQVEGEIRAIEFRIQQLTQQIATLRTATSTGSPEMQALMRQLITQFLRMQRQGGQMGMMPMLRPGGGGFDLYGTNQLGNAAMGYGYGRVGTMGGGIGYYPMGYAPVGVVGSPVVGPPMMGPPMMGPGPMPFPPRPPMMGGGMVMGGGFFTAPKPSGNDSRPV